MGGTRLRWIEPRATAWSGPISAVLSPHDCICALHRVRRRQHARYELRLTPQRPRPARPAVFHRPPRAPSPSASSAATMRLPAGLRVSQVAQKTPIRRRGPPAPRRHCARWSSSAPAAPSWHAAGVCASAMTPRPRRCGPTPRRRMAQRPRGALNSSFTPRAPLSISAELVCPLPRARPASRPSRTSGRSALRRVQHRFHRQFRPVGRTHFLAQRLHRRSSARILRRRPQVTPTCRATTAAPARRGRALSLEPGRYRCVCGCRRTARLPRRGQARQRTNRPHGKRLDSRRSRRGELLLAKHPTAAAGHRRSASPGRQAATAAEVTALQLFRDLFSREVRGAASRFQSAPSRSFFTDLKNSTQLYTTSATPPPSPRAHAFRLLKTASPPRRRDRENNGDAIMAVFPAVAALRALLQAQPPRRPQDEPSTGPPRHRCWQLALKAAIHCGPCLAINQKTGSILFGSDREFTRVLRALERGPT